MSKDKAVITPATWITIGRLILVFPVLVPLLSGHPHGNLISFFLFGLAVASDAVDGYVARRFNHVSALGKFLDPIADKLLVSGLLVVLCLQGSASIFASLLIIVRELLVTAIRWQAMRREQSFSASAMAKLKTDCQWLGIALLLLFKHLPQPELMKGLGNAFLYLAVLLGVYSAVGYSRYSFGDKRQDSPVRPS